MRIALLTDGVYPYVVGGMQKHSYNLAKYFALRKIDVDLYHTIPSNSKYDISKLDVFTADEKEYIHSKLIIFPKRNYYPGHYLRESFQYSSAIYKQLIASPLPDFVYAQGYTGWKFIKQKKKGIKLPQIAVNFHGLEMFQQAASIKSRLQQLLLRDAASFNLIHADYVFTYGGKMKELQLKIGCRDEQLILSPNATEVRWVEKTPSPNNKPIRFLFIGRYERRKGIQELSAVLKELLLDSNFEFEFHFVGPIPEKMKIQDKKILYHGSVLEFESIKKIITQMDVLVCPSLAEGMPTVILEAMASGLAIIATDTGGTQSWVSDKTGWLIAPGSIDELRAALVSAIGSNSNDLTLKKTNAIALVQKKYLWESVMNETINNITQRLK